MFTGVLANRTVLELGSMIAAPFATHILNQMGAEVIKIEPPSGDTTRKLVRGGPSGTYIAYNRGKKSICLDLRSDRGLEIFHKLVKNADVVVHNLSPGAARRLGVSYTGCSAINPAIIYCHIKGYGAGPLSEGVASNPIAEAATGVMYANRVDGRPSRLGPSYHDQFAGCYAVMAILSALLDAGGDARRRNIELGLYETGLHIAARELVGVQLNSQLLGRQDQEPSPEFSIPGYGAYETRDNRWIYLVMLTDEHWSKFCKAASVATDPELATLRQRRKSRPQVEQLVSAAVETFDYDELARKLSEVGAGFTEVLSPDRVLDAPQARESGKYAQFPFSGYAFAAPNFPLPALTGENVENSPPPLLGEHTYAVLQQIGYEDEEIRSFITEGAALTANHDAELWAKVRDAKA
ncbi:CaiB/BaiF CoA transferase family protein [Pseudochelatococcus lubricantis]|uniref:CaiB/BaiF CoA transferase family protein n=1 Tax=Pseudochelatococcus lubricantis TaxID=1538102 RepID=UPI0035E4B742